MKRLNSCLSESFRMVFLNLVSFKMCGLPQSANSLFQELKSTDFKAKRVEIHSFRSSYTEPGGWTKWFLSSISTLIVYFFIWSYFVTKSTWLSDAVFVHFPWLSPSTASFSPFIQNTEDHRIKLSMIGMMLWNGCKMWTGFIYLEGCNRNFPFFLTNSFSGKNITIAKGFAKIW